MLDQETKRKIDNARDILVGKVPDPKSQVEQITIALIYKFMDDMDKESEEWGGKSSFFTGKYEKYAWSKIFDPRLGGFDLIALYSDAIVEMNKNPNLPQLFRDIFKNAYLPYRDPETLKSFLKEINEFTYDHSERLGDAFEYLLSVMDSQGEAGQFRTPRHIIDFIVEIVDPKKNETVIDPACGTAGFLISSYKHILRENTKDRPGDQLTPDKKKRLMSNFTGYDISPDMVRLSLVNLYLHSFSDPKIHEYDTLTSEERWDETADVVLANPPFMTPKGGIRPHKRFSIQAKRSEVLFVDYIAEHLNPNGRAGVIAPEGIIFQSQTAYKNLRKMLVEDYLWAVVSLPSGVFQPYSGVKTSILLMDKMLAKKTDKILFVKIENDGFDLGAQRRPVDKNDLPKALKYIKDYQQAVMTSRYVEETDFTIIAEKNKIAENGDWNLTGERYRIYQDLPSFNYELVKLGDVCILSGEYGSGAKKVEYDNEIRYIRITDIDDNGILKDDKIVSPSIIEEKYFLKKGDLLFARSGSVGRCYLHKEDKGKYQYAGYLIRFMVDEMKVLPEFVFYITKSNFYQAWVKSQSKTATLSNINAKQFSSFQFPLLLLDVQKAIIAEIDGYQKIIDGARQVVSNYKPAIKIDPDWEIVELKDVIDFIGGFAFKSSDLTKEKVNENQLPVLKIGNFKRDGILSLDDVQYHHYENRFSKYLIKKNDILIAMTGATVGKVAISKTKDLLLNQRVGLVRPKQGKVIQGFVYSLLMRDEFYSYCQKTAGGGAQGNISPTEICKFKIPIPPLSVQQKIVAQIEAEQEMVDVNQELIEIYEKKIKDKIAEVWGEKP